VIGPDGPVILLDVFEGRSQSPTRPFARGPYAESNRYREFMGWDVPWYSARDSAEALVGEREFAQARLLPPRR
jgi:hypothetical protein